MKYKVPKTTQGIALVTVLILLVVTITLVSTASLLALGNRRSSTDNLLTIKAQYAAESGIEETLNKLFYATRANFDTLKTKSGGPNANAAFDMCTYKLLLTGIVGIDGAATAPKNDNNNGACQYGWTKALAVKGDPAKVVDPVFPGLYNNVELSGVNQITGTVDGAEYAVSVTRKDAPKGDDILFSFVSTGMVKTGTQEIATRVLKRTISIAGSPFNGDRYAMLTTATNCAFCHLHVDTMERVYSTDTTKTFDRALVGVLSPKDEVLDFCSEWNRDSVVGGTIYTRSKGINYDCADQNRVLFYKWHGSAGLVKGGKISDAKGNFLSNSDNTNTKIADFNLDASVIDAKTNPSTSYGKMYSNYPDSISVQAAPFNGNWPDEILPDDFPTIIPDDGDKLISDAEWANYLASAPGGYLTGGTMYGVRRPGSSATTTPITYDPVSANTTLNATTIAGQAGVRSLVNDLGTLFANINDTATQTAFVANWRGWLIQQALASQNNRDFQPTNPTFYSSQTNAASFQSRAYFQVNTTTAITTIGNNKPVTVTPLPLRIYAPNTNANIVPVQFFNPADLSTSIATASLRTGGLANGANANIAVSNLSAPVPAGSVARIFVRWFVPISWGDQSRTNTGGFKSTDGTGATENNFWVDYNTPNSGDLQLTFCTDKTTDCPNKSTLVVPNVNDSVIFPVAGTTTATNTATALGTTGAGGARAGYFDGNVILDAGRLNSAANTEMTINGTVLVNGDIVIRGRFKGEGRLIARGNIYVVGDMVYDCGGRACKTSEYATPATLTTKLALLAGGGIFIGDFDISRSDTSGNWTNSLSLANDQTLQRRTPSGTLSYAYYNVPGGTGTANQAGFLAELLPDMNYRNDKRYFLTAPFGFVFKAKGRSTAYEDNDSTRFLGNLGTSSIIPTAPSNGPVMLGNKANSGLFKQTGTSGLSNVLSCSSSDFSGIYDPALPPVAGWTNGGFNDVANRPSFNFTTWCPKSAGNYLRNGSSVVFANASTPANNDGAWVAQPTQNKAVDGGLGMTTGWLGGLLALNAAGEYTQIGDLSQTKILKLMWLSTIQNSRDADPNNGGASDKGPFRTDGIFYSPQAIFGLVRSRLGGSNGANTTGTQGRWVHNGSIISYELGFLAPGPLGDVETPLYSTSTNKLIDFATADPASTTTIGPGMGLYYDKRMAGFLGIESGIEVKIKPIGGYAPTAR
jgi:hypothetical protein